MAGDTPFAARGNAGDQPPEEYQRFVLDEVRSTDEMLTLVYGGRVFGGVVRCLLDPNGVEDVLRPGTAIFVRYHNQDTGAPGQVAHIIVRHPSAEGWAEVYSDAV
jgi:hypothetical protein